MESCALCVNSARYTVTLRLFILMLKSGPRLAGRGPLSVSYIVLTRFHLILRISHFQSQQGAHLVFSLLTALISHCFKSHDSFEGVWCLETKIWEVGVLIITEILLPQSSYNGQIKKPYKIYIVR